MQPLVDYLGKHTGAKVEITIPTNYAAVVEALVNDQSTSRTWADSRTSRPRGALASSRSSSVTATASSTASS